MGRKSKGAARRKQKRDAKLVEQATRREETESDLGMFDYMKAKIDKLDKDGSGNLFEGRGPPDVQNRRKEILEKHGARWKEKSSEIFDHVFGRAQYAEGILAATELLDDIESQCQLVKFESKVKEWHPTNPLLSLNLIHIYIHERITATFARMFARDKLGDYNGALKDAVDGLALCEMPVKYGDMPPMLQLRFIGHRAIILEKRGDLEGSVADLRAVCAMLRLHGGNIEQLDFLRRGDGEVFVFGNLHEALAGVMRLKKKAGVTRPYFTKEEANQIGKEFGINAHDPENYHCLNCGVVSPTLSRCSGCCSARAWFCGTECQSASWRDGHKNVCRNSATRSIEAEQYTFVKGLLAKRRDGLAAVIGRFLTTEHRLRLSPRDPGAVETFVFAIDENTGVMFDCLSDADIIVQSSLEDDMTTLNIEEAREEKCASGEVEQT